MFELNGTLVVFILMFVIFMFLLNKVFMEPVGRVLQMRAAKIKSDYEAAKEFRADAEAVLERYQKHIGEMRQQAQNLINDAVEGAQREREKEIKKIQEEGVRRLREVKQSLITERRAMLGELADQEIEFVKIISQKLVGDSVIVALDHDKVKRALEEAS